MSTMLDHVVYLDELADFLTTRPSREELLEFHPSELVESRFAELMSKQRDAGLLAEEQEELDQFRQAELLLRLLKARLRQGRVTV